MSPCVCIAHHFLVCNLLIIRPWKPGTNLPPAHVGTWCKCLEIGWLVLVER